MVGPTAETMVIPQTGGDCSSRFFAKSAVLPVGALHEAPGPPSQHLPLQGRLVVGEGREAQDSGSK